MGVKFPTTSPVDFDAARARVDLQALVAQTCRPGRRGRYVCPFHVGDSGHGTLTVRVDGSRWSCWSCGAKGGSLDFLARLHNVSPVEAARIALGLTSTPARAIRQPLPTTAPHASQDAQPAWKSPAWQEAVDRIVLDAETALWNTADGREVLAWLRNVRCLQDHTIRRYRLGFVPRPTRRHVAGFDAVHIARGVLIPWAHPAGWYDPSPDAGTPDYRWAGANVRRLGDNLDGPVPNPKYQAITGSRRGYAYPWPDLAPGVPALIVEGEFDALVAQQLLGHVVNVVSVGGAQQTPQSEALDALDGCLDWLVVPDGDRAGAASLAKWEALDPDRTVPVLLPGGAKDLTEAVQQGSDLIDWLRSEWLGMGWDLPRSLQDHDQGVLAVDPEPVQGPIDDSVPDAAAGTRKKSANNQQAATDDSLPETTVGTQKKPSSNHQAATVDSLPETAAGMPSDCGVLIADQAAVEASGDTPDVEDADEFLAQIEDARYGSPTSTTQGSTDDLSARSGAAAGRAGDRPGRAPEACGEAVGDRGPHGV